MTRLIYGFDPLCGWCYGLVPALRQLRGCLPELAIHPVMGGLVTGARIGRYADMGDYIRDASVRMTGVTGMALSPAFFDNIIGNPYVIASSLVPCAAVLQVRTLVPDRAADFASAVQVAHFGEGSDLNDVALYDQIAQDLGIALPFDLPGPRTPTPALMAEFAAAHALGITRYPTLIVEKAGRFTPLPTSYDPAAVVEAVSGALRST